MNIYRVDLDRMLQARERRVSIQNKMLADAGSGHCLVCLTMNIPGDVKRTPMTRMLFDAGVAEMASAGFRTEKELILDEATGSEAFWLLDENGPRVKAKLETVEDAYPAARLYDFDVIMPDGAKLSRATGRKCLICDAYAAECARSRRHGLEQVMRAVDDLLVSFCSARLAREAYGALMDELHTTPKPGLVDMNNNGAHTDMDAALFEKSAASLIPYFEDAVRMGTELRGMEALRERGKKAEAEMFAATGGVNTHKGLIYSMGLLLAGMGRCLREGGSCTGYAASLAAEDAEACLERSQKAPDTNGGAVYRSFGAKGAIGEASAGFPDALYCLSRLEFYRDRGCREPGALSLCDSMAVLEDTNLLHRGGAEGLAFVQRSAAVIAGMPLEDRVGALTGLDEELIGRNLSPGGSADMLAIALLLERWQKISAGLFTYQKGSRQHELLKRIWDSHAI